MELPFRLRVQSTPLVPRELERRSVAPGDMKSLIVEEMSILWSAIGGVWNWDKEAQRRVYFHGLF